METAIIDKNTKALLSTYKGSRAPESRWINLFGGMLADPEKVDHVEIPDCPDPERFLLNTSTLEWVLDIKTLRAEKERALKEAAWEALLASSPEGAKFEVAKNKLFTAKTETEIKNVAL